MLVVCCVVASATDSSESQRAYCMAHINPSTVFPEPWDHLLSAGAIVLGHLSCSVLQGGPVFLP